MNDELKAALMGAIYERSAIACKNAPMPPPPESGKDRFKIKIGTKVRFTGKIGVWIVTDRAKENGWATIEAETKDPRVPEELRNQWFRQCDAIKV